MFSKCTHIDIKSNVTDPNTVRLLASQMTGDYSGFKNQIGEAINKQKTGRLMSKSLFAVCFRYLRNKLKRDSCLKSDLLLFLIISLCKTQF